MNASLVHDGGDTVYVPLAMGQWRQEDQMQGTLQEQLMEVAGRCCYDSMGTGRPSREYHDNLLNVQKHYSVAEHVHFTVESMLSPIVWMGIPDCVVTLVDGGLSRVTANLRHVLEWPNCVTMLVQDNQPIIEHVEGLIKEWELLLRWVGHTLAPSAIPKPAVAVKHFTLGRPMRDAEAFVSLWLEDSRVWSHEMVRHRGNMSQRSGRFVDETDRVDCVHPLMRDYLDELGYFELAGIDDPLPPVKVLDKTTKVVHREAVFKGGKLDEAGATDRGKFLDRIAQHQTNANLLYGDSVDRLQDWQMKRGIDKTTARKQARSAARYYLGNGLSTEMVFTASIRHWRHIFKMRRSPAADAAIRELMDLAHDLVKGSRYGHLL
jgi:thymidylate synthase ThyX